MKHYKYSGFLYITGSLMLWDCISSRLLKTYNPEISKRSRICNVLYEDIHGAKFIFAATVNRSVRIFEVNFASNTFI